jgi:RES domain-containing protein
VLERALADSLTLTLPFEGVVFRSMGLRYANEEDATSGAGASLYGGRWNPVGLATFYASLSIELAGAEALATSRYYRTDPARTLPRVDAAFDVRLQRVLDLTERRVRRRLRVTITALKTLDWRAANNRGEEALTQAIGRCAAAVGFEALIVPSSEVPRGRNLVAFPAELRKGSRIRPRGLKGLDVFKVRRN